MLIQELAVCGQPVNEEAFVVVSGQTNRFLGEQDGAELLVGLVFDVAVQSRGKV